MSAGSRLRSVVEVLRAAQRRSSQRQGATFAAAISMRGFLALFPIVLLAVAVIGFVSASTDDLAQVIVNELGLTGDAARIVTRAVETAQRSRVSATIVGIVGLLWTGTGLAAALTETWNAMWDEPGGALRGRVAGLVWLAGGAVLLVTTLAGSALVRALPTPLDLAGIAVSLAADFALFLWTARVLPARRISVAAMVPGAIVGAIGFEAVKLFGTLVVPILVSRSSALYGTIGVVFAILVWMLLLGRVFVLAICVEHETAQGASRSRIQPDAASRR